MAPELTRDLGYVDAKFRRLITRLLLVLSLGVVILTPSLYLYTGLSYEQERVASESQQLANSIETLVSLNPRMWTFQNSRIDSILSQGARLEFETVQRKVVFVSVQTLDGSIVSQYGEPADWYVITGVSNIRDGDGVVGRLVLLESVAHVWQRAGLVLVAAMILGFVVFVTARTLPLRALDRSIHERDDAQAALMAFNAELEKTIAGRTSELEAALQLAEAANKAKSSFLSSMSHELRTPMNAILGFGQLLDGNIKVRQDANEIVAIDNIMHAGRHLLELINQVLELNTLDGGNTVLSISNVPLSEPIMECMDVMEAAAAEKRVHIIGPDFTVPLPVAKTDRVRLRQVLFNLVSNAIKYNRDEGSVTILSHQLDENWVRITVSDTGSGIPAEFQHLLFVPFERLGREAGEIQGTGIGLAICKALVEAMNGRLTFDPTEAVGSKFHFDLPRGDIEETLPDEPPHLDLPPPSTEPRVGLVLCVEDNAQSSALMEMIFEDFEGIDLITARNGEIGLSLAQSHRPGLILMDINLPGMDGIECFRQLRENKDTADIPVVAVSAGAMPDDIRKITRAGFDDYLIKPIDVADLSALVSEHFE